MCASFLLQGDSAGDQNGKDEDDDGTDCTLAVCGVDLMVTHTNPHEEASVQIDNAAAAAAGSACGEGVSKNSKCSNSSSGSSSISGSSGSSSSSVNVNDASTFHCVVLEVNNNPALPVPGKLMTSSYSEHVVHMVNKRMKP